MKALWEIFLIFTSKTLKLFEGYFQNNYNDRTLGISQI